jgi:hypothetical protein
VCLKLDTQGYDRTVLDGARSALRGILTLQLELSVQPIYKDVPTYLEVIPQLNSMGFELSGLFPVALDRNLKVIELDAVMVRTRR